MWWWCHKILTFVIEYWNTNESLCCMSHICHVSVILGNKMKLIIKDNELILFKLTLLQVLLTVDVSTYFSYFETWDEKKIKIWVSKCFNGNSPYFNLRLCQSQWSCKTGSFGRTEVSRYNNGIRGLRLFLLLNNFICRLTVWDRMSIPAGKLERVKILFGSFSFACSAVSWVMNYHYFYLPCCLRHPPQLFHAHHLIRGFLFDSWMLDVAAEISMRPRVVASMMAMYFPGCVLNSL